MRKAFPFFILFINLFSCPVWSQTDSLDINKTNPIIWYFGGGLGFCNTGGVFELSFNVATGNYWGAGINFRTNMSKSDNVPSDYYDDGIRVVSPKDYLTAVSFNFLKKFPISKKNVRIGIETGPAWVRYKLAEFEANPDYDPNYERSSWDWGPRNYLYLKSHEVTSKIGFSLAGRTEFIFEKSFSLDLAIYTVINGFQSIVGLDVCINLGRIEN
jgi:hypothetical protein